MPGVVVLWCKARKTLQTRIEGNRGVSDEAIEIKGIDVLSRELRQVVVVMGSNRH
jgi:hypothetical protein